MTLTKNDIKPLEDWEEMCWQTGGASEETLLVETSKVADELDSFLEKGRVEAVVSTVNSYALLYCEVRDLIKTLRGNGK